MSMLVRRIAVLFVDGRQRLLVQCRLKVHLGGHGVALVAPLRKGLGEATGVVGDAELQVVDEFGDCASSEQPDHDHAVSRDVPAVRC